MMRMTYLLLLFITLFPRAASGEAFDVDTYLRMHDASEISVSPDGQFIAYTLYERDLEPVSYTHLTLPTSDLV